MKFFYILMLIESGADPSAVGDNGDAVGALQIHECVITDVNRVYYTHFTPEDRLDKEKSLEIASLYLMHYAPNDSWEAMARTWNGGPRGYYKQSTVKYWNKFKELM